MSHISKIELVIHSLEDLKEACRQLGFEFIKNQKTFNGMVAGSETRHCQRGLKLKISVNVITPYGSLVAIMKSVSLSAVIIISSYGTIILLAVLNQRSDLMLANSNRRIPLQEFEKRLEEKDIECREKKIDQGVRLVLTV